MAPLGLLLACQTDDGDCRTERPCEAGGGEYFILEPDAPTGRTFMFLHGAANDNESVLKKVDEQAFLDAGVRLVLPDSADGRWAVSGGPEAVKDDAAFLAVVADRLRADGLADELVLGGHSVGSSMAWFTGCYESVAFDAYVPTSGGFWEPVPATCGGAIALRHTHGTDDTFVPLGGRPLGGGATQANVLEGMALWAETNGCDPEPSLRVDGIYECSVYEGCEAPLEICLHDGGHVLRNDWEARALQWMDAVL
jgi:polyhydroxybutyrate depolymerase